MKKLFCIDIDGTLLKSDGTISEHTIKVLNELKRRGNEIVLCSARSRKSVIDICKLINVSNYIVSSNGAEIYDCFKDTLIFSNSVNKDTCARLWNICNNNDFTISFAINDTEYVNSQFWDNQIKINSIDDIDINKVKSIMIVFCNYNKGLELFNQIKKSNVVKSCCYKIEKDDIGFWFNVLDINTSKGDAIGKLSNILNISKENIVSFGNDFNDISMFLASGESYAVANSDTVVKKLANKIIMSNDDDGVANHILNNYFDV